MGPLDIWLRDLDSGADKQITVDKGNESPGEISADGTRIAFARHRSEGGRDIYVADLARGAEKRIIEGAGYWPLVLSSSASWMVALRV